MNTKNKEDNPSKLREIVLNTRTPIVLRNFTTHWKCSEETLEDWCERFDEARKNAEIEFEQMSINSNTQHPQWERGRKIVKMTMKQFLQEHTNESQDYWTGLNYKTSDEIPKECKENIDFSCFGFPDLLDEYARFWLGSACSNTPCHFDTYGCNIVAQIYGSKSWLLFPPNTSLTTTRVPYEESSIYCLENFYAPTPEQVNELQRFKNEAYMCEVNAGDVLIVPRHWWHFVETIDTSLSINAWVPLEVDSETQLQECVVKYLIESIVKQENFYARKYFLNPNQEELSSEEDILNILAFLCDVYPTKHEEKTKTNIGNYSYQYLAEEKVDLLLKEFPNGHFVEKASPSAYEKLMDHNAERFVHTSRVEATPSERAIKEALINSICSGNIVKEIAREFRARYDRIVD